MDAPEIYEDFIDYLKDGEGSWEERGLVDNAPESAVEAYEKFVEQEKEDRQQGIV